VKRLNLTRDSLLAALAESDNCDTCEYHSVDTSGYFYVHSCPYMKNTKELKKYEKCSRPSGCLIRGWYKPKDALEGGGDK
jgi:hypothetical protein